METEQHCGGTKKHLNNGCCFFNSSVWCRSKSSHVGTLFRDEGRHLSLMSNNSEESSGLFQPAVFNTNVARSVMITLL